MTCSIVYDAIQIKITRFEKPASLINMNELAAAILTGYRQAGLTPPDIAVGLTAEEFRQQFLQDIHGKDSVNPKLIAAIREYPQEEDIVDEAAKATYAFGLTLPDLR